MSGYYTAPIRSNPMTGQNWQQPSYFRAQASERGDWIASQIRADVDVGRVPAQALDEVTAERRQLDAMIKTATADGIIDPAERDRVQSFLEYMAHTGQRWGGPAVYGGGPRVIDEAGHHLYENNWRRLY